MPTVSRGRAVAAAFGLFLAPILAHGAGFSIYEQGGRATGFAGAYTALAQDPSAIFYNGAGIAFLKDKQLYIGGTLIFPSSDFAGANPFPGTGVREQSDVGVVPIPTLYYTQPFSERIAVGVGIDTPFGLHTQWADPDRYTGRYISQRADLKSVSVNPTVAFKLADRFSIGVGLDVRFAKVELVRRVPSVNPFTLRVVDIAEATLESDWTTGFGFNLGILAKPTDRLSLGVTYRHKVKADFQGGARFEQVPTGNAQFDTLVTSSLPAGIQPLSTNVEFPAMAGAGAAYSVSDWTIAADVLWFQWSSFDRLDIIFADRSDLNEIIPQNYTNSWQFRVGVERRLNDRWTVRGGYHYDPSPAPAASVSPLLPDAARHGAAAGLTWHSGRLWIDAGSWYLFFKDRSTEGVNRDNYNGIYSSSAFTFGVSLGYRF